MRCGHAGEESIAEEGGEAQNSHNNECRHENFFSQQKQFLVVLKSIFMI